MELLVAYDIATTTTSGQLRLRKVAQICQSYGQRVQYSVFECVVNAAQAELLRRDLLDAINPKTDSIRIYRLREPHSKHTWLAGRQREYDIRGPLIF